MDLTDYLKFKTKCTFCDKKLSYPTMRLFKKVAVLRQIHHCEAVNGKVTVTMKYYVKEHL